MPKCTQPCLCHSGQELPRTLKALREQTKVTTVGAGLETLALVGTQLTDALITTNNGAALLTGRGGYAAFQTAAMPFKLSRRRVNMRVSPDVPTNLVRSDDPNNARQTLALANMNGDITHRVETLGGYDGRVVDAIEPQLSPNLQTPPQQIDAGVVPLAAVRNARDNWETRDTGHHLNDILADNGHTRHQTLPYVGKNQAWRVTVQTLVSFVSFLCGRKIGHARLVPGDGFIQSDLSSAGQAQMADKVLLVRDEAANFALDISQVGSLWVTHFQGQSQLEIYDQNARAITILRSDPAEDLSYWNALLASLPPASYSVA
ncbi:hypothetical protein [Loktanella sp. S4079]|uniref:hypothetical protein n=1 Tax=Loktanella sp. S4079 TaxID=579483 RepID=UPI0005FA71A8|nr:hypothetical protein [Loktanella sp. S4079]KJZ18568.1 hypothetical protein TW80_14215 [Loktanella sp. S4079]